uniref:PAT complex subunit Asterix n=1 Tax=Salvator merianae TaxID=96440 RepID=A0A8D0BA00_SALMN
MSFNSMADPRRPNRILRDVFLKNEDCFGKQWFWTCWQQLCGHYSNSSCNNGWKLHSSNYWLEKYKPPSTENNPTLEDPTPDYMNLLGMIFSMCGLMLKLKWCAWIAVYCSFISFANSRSSEDTKQMMSSFMLSISAVVMSYLQNPQPMSPPW